jgi:RNA polymerase sigma factor (sigma-70 family)
MATQANPQAGALLSGPSIWTSEFYNRLRQRAQRLIRIGGWGLPDPLQPEDLIHDAYLRLARSEPISNQRPGSHLALATRVMKNALIDRARAGRATKRFGQLKQVELSTDIPAPKKLTDTLWVNQIFDHSSLTDPRYGVVAKLYFVEGQSLAEIASALNRSTRTVKRDIRTVTLQLRNEFFASANQSHRVAKPIRRQCSPNASFRQSCVCAKL